MFSNIILGFTVLLFVIPFTYILVADFIDAATRIIKFTKPYVTLLISKLT